MYMYIKHMQPFGCRVNYRPLATMLTDFGSRVLPGLHLLHDDEGILRILTDDGGARTKHVTFLENQFPGISVIGYNHNTLPVPNTVIIMMELQLFPSLCCH